MKHFAVAFVIGFCFSITILVSAWIKFKFDEWMFWNKFDLWKRDKDNDNKN